MLREFREFAIRGNVIDMAVGIMIGGAFTTVVKSMVEDLVMPPLGLLTGELDFSDRFLLLSQDDPSAPYPSLAAARAAGAVVVAYGSFVNNCISLTLVALSLFFLVRWINRLRRPDPPAASNTKSCPYCKSTIDVAATRCAHCTSALQ